MFKKYKPVTPSQRHTILLDKTNLNKKSLIPNKIKNIKKSFGRNNQGRITIKHRGGGHKRKYRIIEFKRENLLPGAVKSIEYDPNRSAFIASLDNGNDFNYIIAPENLKINDYLEAGPNVPIKLGNSLPLKNIPIGSLIHNISLKKKSKGKLIRSAGTYAQLLQKNDDKYATVRLISGEIRLIPLDCYATLGIVSNINNKNIKIGKAGRKRWLNRRPRVRGVAKNPVDHPHGGGEGKTSGGRPSVSFTGFITKGKPTKKKKNKLIIKKRS